MKDISTCSRRLILAAVLFYLIFECVTAYFSFTGETGQSSRELALKYFSSDDIEQAEKLARERLPALKAHAFFSLLLLLFFAMSEKIKILADKLSRGIAGNHYYGGLIIIAAFFYLIDMIVSFPFSYYLGYIIEHRWGFSNMSFLQWFFFFLKNRFINLLVFLLMTVTLFWIFKTFKKSWVFVLPATVFFAGIFMILLNPILITPLFYTERPLEEGELKKVLLEIAKKAGAEVQEISVIDESRYSKHTNAYFEGLGSRKRIVLYDTLLCSHTTSEVALIFAHEAGHWKHNHMFLGLLFSTAGAFLVCLVLLFTKDFFIRLKAEGFFDERSYTVLFMALLLTRLVSPLEMAIENSISRFMERQADLVSLELTGSPETFIAAEKKLAVTNRLRILPHPFNVFFFNTHPPVLERIMLAERFKSSLFAD